MRFERKEKKNEIKKKNLPAEYLIAFFIFFSKLMEIDVKERKSVTKIIIVFYSFVKFTKILWSKKWRKKQVNNVSYYFKIENIFNQVNFTQKNRIDKKIICLDKKKCFLILFFSVNFKCALINELSICFHISYSHHFRDLIFPSSCCVYFR